MEEFKKLQAEIVLKNKNGINFILAASICWLIIAGIWCLPLKEVQKAWLTFFATLPMMPLAFLFSKIFKTEWNIEDNPLNKLGLWLNFAQLFYFPFLFIFFAKNPVEMPMALAIITGAHLFPYAWFYQSKGYGVIAGIISLGASIIGTSKLQQPQLIISLFLVCCFWVLAIWIYSDYKSVRLKALD